MDKIKNLLLGHFEKFAMAAAIFITLMFLIGVFRRARVDDLREDIGDLIQTIEINMQGAGVEDIYDPKQVGDYAEKALGPFKDVPKAVRLVGVRFYPRVIVELKPIKLELPPGVAFEKTFKTYPEREESKPPETTVVRIDNENLGSVELVDPQHFVLRRGVDLAAEDGSTLIHVYYADERHCVRRLEVTIRVVYIPQPPQEVVGYPKPGRNFIIWQTHPDDFEKVIGFNIYRKESKEAGFDIENPLNRKELIQPLDYVPKFGEDEEGETEEGEGEPTAPDEETEKDKSTEKKGKEEPDNHLAFPPQLPGTGEEEVFSKRPSIFARNVGGKFMDRDVTPLQTYWYAVQTVAEKPKEEQRREMAGEEKDALYVKSILSKPVFIKGGDVIKLVFMSLLGNPERKGEVRAVIDVRRFVKVSWVTGRFVVKIGGRIGGKTWVKEYPEIDPETGAVTHSGRMVDFVTKYTLKDVIVVRKQEEYTDWIFILNKETGRMTRKPVKKFRKIKTYKIIVKHDDGSLTEYPMKTKRKSPTTPKTIPDKKSEQPEDRRRREAEERRNEAERRRIGAQRRLMKEREQPPLPQP